VPVLERLADLAFAGDVDAGVDRRRIDRGIGRRRIDPSCIGRRVDRLRGIAARLRRWPRPMACDDSEQKQAKHAEI
jgi:hypothetical protein